VSGVFAGLPEQPEARRLLEAALGRPSHAYLLSGPEGSCKRDYAGRFAAALLDCDPARVAGRTHPDLFVLEPEGAGILMDDARRLRRDLHLRPFEADRRVYLILDAHLLRDDGANALLKSLEEPPEYGVFVLVSDHAGRMLPTILSRLATVPFRPFPAAVLAERTGDPVAARVAMGNLRRAERLAADPEAAERRRMYLAVAAGSRRDPAFDSAGAAAEILEAANRCGREEGKRVAAELEALLASVDDDRERRALSKRFDERGKRAARRAEWDELRLAVDTIGLWYRDALAGELGAKDAMLDSAGYGEPPNDAMGGGVEATLEALSVVLDVRRSFELNVHPALALEALLARLAGAPATVRA
jgi:DNA polymerase III subunit delta'